MIAQTKVPTAMLKSVAKRAAPRLVLITALDDTELEAAEPERVALVESETLLVVLIAVGDVVDVDTTSLKIISPVSEKKVGKRKALTYNKELVYVVHDEVAGVTTGEFPAGAWLSPRQAENSFGLYAAGILKKHPSTSNLFSQ
jgi:hypothetical protein